APCNGCRVTFTPNPTFSGTCTFTYRVSSNARAPCTDSAMVTVTVKSAPDAQDDLITVTPMPGVPIPVHVLDNDTPGAGCSFDLPSRRGTSGRSHGTTSVNNSNGVITFTPDATLTNTDSFCYRICTACEPGVDMPLCCDTACATISPTPPCPEENRLECASLLLYPEFDSRSGALTLVTVTDGCCTNTGTLIEIVFIHKTSCL